jgi:hypothetical protein
MPNVQSDAKVWEEDRKSHPENEYVFNLNGQYRVTLRYAEFMGTWNGYIRLPDGHPDIGNSYDVMSEYIDVHGGFTYASDNEYGFDTAHLGNLVPKLRIKGFDTVYWTFDMVKEEALRVVEQFRARENTEN